MNEQKQPDTKDPELEETACRKLAAPGSWMGVQLGTGQRATIQSDPDVETSYVYVGVCKLAQTHQTMHAKIRMLHTNYIQ